MYCHLLQLTLSFNRVQNKRWSILKYKLKNLEIPSANIQRLPFSQNMLCFVCNNSCDVIDFVTSDTL